MPAYKDKKTNKWLTKFHYKDYYGNDKQTSKRGFDTKEEALAYEEQFKHLIKENKLYLPFEVFVEEYFKDKISKFRDNTIETKHRLYNSYIIPYFKGKLMSQIKPKDIVEWIEKLQNTSTKNNKPPSKQYINSLITEVKQIFKYATLKYNLQPNPTLNIPSFKREDRKIKYLTFKEYSNFIKHISKKDLYFYLYECLYYTGIKENELLALNIEDVDFKKKTIQINKVFENTNTIRDLNNSSQSRKKYQIRNVVITEKLIKELKYYLKKIRRDDDPRIFNNPRLFPVSKSPLKRFSKKITDEYNLKPMNIDILRNSHVYYLINSGIDSYDIAKRVGLQYKTFLTKYKFMLDTKNIHHNYSDIFTISEDSIVSMDNKELLNNKNIKTHIKPKNNNIITIMKCVSLIGLVFLIHKIKKENKYEK